MTRIIVTYVPLTLLLVPLVLVDIVFTSAFSTSGFSSLIATQQQQIRQNDVVTTQSSSSSLFAATSTTNESELKSDILNLIGRTKRGLSATMEQRIEIEKAIRALEASCQLKEPARDPRMEGKWEVLYTTAPPPSNGQLGPFTGVAKQSINLDNGGYQNILEVGDWLVAVLDASWEEWDGTLLIDNTKDSEGSAKWQSGVVAISDDADEDIGEPKEVDESSNPLGFLQQFLNGGDRKTSSTPDYGAASWKVDFKDISINIFGTQIINKKFGEGTSRIWKMTYLDDTTRIVRAGRTGNSKDDVVFYMVRDT